MNLSDQLGTLLPAKFVADKGKDNSDFYQRKILKTTIKFITKKKKKKRLINKHNHECEDSVT